MPRFFLATPAGTAFALAAALVCIAMTGCRRAAPSEAVVVYTSVDEPFARQILDLFQRRSGIRVEAVFDAEAGKTTGFIQRLRREAQRPRCDVWWSGEVFGAIELARAYVLDRCDPPAAADIPAEWRDPEGRWIALAARARVVAFDPQRITREALPQDWRGYSEKTLAAESAVANPLFGTTRGHVAAMFAYWGEQPARDFLQALRDANVKLADGNSHAVRLISEGRVALCWTDTDDVWVAQQRGARLESIYPKLAADTPPLWIPCSVGLVRGAPHAAAARRLVDFLVSAEVERALAESDSRNVPVRAALREELGRREPAPEALDFRRIADALPAADTAVRDILLH